MCVCVCVCVFVRSSWNICIQLHSHPPPLSLSLSLWEEVTANKYILASIVPHSRYMCTTETHTFWCYVTKKAPVQLCKREKSSLIYSAYVRTWPTDLLRWRETRYVWSQKENWVSLTQIQTYATHVYIYIYIYIYQLFITFQKRTL